MADEREAWRTMLGAYGFSLARRGIPAAEAVAALRETMDRVARGELVVEGLEADPKLSVALAAARRLAEGPATASGEHEASVSEFTFDRAEAARMGLGSHYAPWIDPRPGIPHWLAWLDELGVKYSVVHNAKAKGLEIRFVAMFEGGDGAADGEASIGARNFTLTSSSGLFGNGIIDELTIRREPDAGDVAVIEIGGTTNPKSAHELLAKIRRWDPSTGDLFANVEQHPAPWRWEREEHGHDMDDVWQLLDANGDRVVSGVTASRYDDDLPFGLDASPAVRARLAAVPRMEALLRRFVDPGPELVSSQLSEAKAILADLDAAKEDDRG